MSRIVMAIMEESKDKINSRKGFKVISETRCSCGEQHITGLKDCILVICPHKGPYKVFSDGRHEDL